MKPLTTSLGRAVARANRYRDSLNPMRGLTMSRVVALVESYARGEFADLMWTYAAPNLGIESADADLLALVERRTGAIVELDWNVKTVDAEYPGWDEKLAGDQAAALAALYYGVDNLSEAIEHLALASFRGFAHLEKIMAADGGLAELRVIEQWNVARDGSDGAWKWNPEARQTTFAALPDEYLLPRETVLAREVRRPINRIGLAKMARQNLSQKDWDAFIEIYGIPSGIVIAPPNLSKEDLPAFYESAKDASGGGTVAFPGNTEYRPNDGPRGVNPFREHLRYLQEQLVLAGTGGLLTMLTAPGSGTLGGNAHQDTFEIIARAEARKISEVFQRGIDRGFLAREFPGRPRLAYFELAANDAVEPGEILEHAGKAAAAGYQMDANELSEKTGYALTVRPSAPGGSPRVTNRAADGDTLQKHLDALLAADDEHFAATLEKLQADLPALLKDADAVAAWENLLGGELLKALQGGGKTVANRDDDGTQPRDRGKFAETGGADGEKKSIGDLYDRALAGTGGQDVKVRLRTVDDAEAARIQAATGLNVSGYTHTVSSSAIQHAVRKHGDANKEAARGQLPVTKEDFARVPEITKTADKVFKGKTNAGLDSVVYVKHEGGTVVVVEEARTGKKELALQTLYKFKSKVEIKNRQAARARALTLTSVTLLPKDSVAETAAKVNWILEAMK